MKYLTAKKRLLFLSSVIKYLRLVMEEGKIINEDQVVSFVKDSFRMVFKGKLTAEDEITLINDIKSFLLRIKDSVKFDGVLNMISKYYVLTESKTETKFENVVELGNAPSKKLNIKEDILFDYINKIITSDSNHQLSLNDYFKFMDSLKIANFDSELFKMVDNFKIDDLTNLNNDVVSTIISIRNNLKFKDNLYFEEPNLGVRYIDINENINFKDLYKFLNKYSEKISIDDKTKLIDISKLNNMDSELLKTQSKFIFSDKVDINNVNEFKIKMQDSFSFLNTLEFALCYSSLVKITDKLLTKNNVEVKDIENFLLNINSGLSFNSSMELDITNIITVPIGANDIFYFDSNINLDFLESVCHLKTNNNIDITTNTNILFSNSNQIKNTQLLNVKDYLRIGRYVYSLLEDIENLDIDDFKDMSIIGVIYKEV